MQFKADKNKKDDKIGLYVSIPISIAKKSQHPIDYTYCICPLITISIAKKKFSIQ